MGKMATKASDNVFCKARYAAGKFNDRLNSREGASEELGMDRTRLAKIELGSINPHPEEVLMMAEIYNAPELKNYFCVNVCPLGECIPKAEIATLDRISIRALAAFKKISEIKETLLDITEDGIISEDETEDLKKILKTLDELSMVTQSLKVWVEKNLD